MTLKSRFTIGILIGFGVLPGAASAVVLGHHGGMIVHCTAPTFFEESPAKEAKVGSIANFSLTASDNTDPETLQAWVNTQPVPITIERQRSGRFTIKGTLPTPITQGRAWIKVAGVSVDGCDELHNWNVYAGQ